MARGAGNLGHHAGSEAFVEEVQELAGRSAAKPSQRVQRELATEDGREAEDSVALLREAFDPPPNDLTNPFRDRQAQPCRVVDGFETAFRREQPDDFSHEQRVTFRLAVDYRHHTVAWRHSGDLLDETGDVRLGEAEQRDMPRRPLARELGQGEGQGVVPAQVDVAIGAQDEDGGVAEFACDELQQQQRRRIGGVQVVEYEHERLVSTGVVKERRDCVEETKPACLRLHRRHLFAFAKTRCCFLFTNRRARKGADIATRRSRCPRSPMNAGPA